MFPHRCMCSLTTHNCVANDRLCGNVPHTVRLFSLTLMYRLCSGHPAAVWRVQRHPRCHRFPREVRRSYGRREARGEGLDGGVPQPPQAIWCAFQDGRAPTGHVVRSAIWTSTSRAGHGGECLRHRDCRLSLMRRLDRSAGQGCARTVSGGASSSAAFQAAVGHRGALHAVCARRAATLRYVTVVPLQAVLD